MGLLQGIASTGIPHLQGFTWYEITSNCYCHFAKNTQGVLVICIIYWQIPATQKKYQ